MVQVCAQQLDFLVIVQSFQDLSILIVQQSTEQSIAKLQPYSESQQLFYPDLLLSSVILILNLWY